MRMMMRLAVDVLTLLLDSRDRLVADSPNSLDLSDLVSPSVSVS